MATSGSQQQYKITEAYIVSDKTGDLRYNVGASIVEIVFFENLEKPYISGQVLILDDSGLFDAMDFQGTERFFLTIASEDESLEPVMSRSFILSGIESINKSSNSGTSSAYLFTMVDEHVFLSALTKISRTVIGTLEEEIVKICAADLKKDVDLSYSAESMQKGFIGNIPYMHPFEACEWLRQRATTDTGAPYFLYASIHDERIRLGNLDTMLQQKAFNSKIPYLYSPSNTMTSEESGSVNKNFQIQSMRSAKIQNTLKLIDTGSIGARYNNTNIGTGRTSSTHVSIEETLENLTDRGTISPEKNQNVVDTAFTIGDKQLKDYDSKIIHTITSSGTYGFYKSYHDEFDVTKFKKKIESRSIHNLLYKNMMEITVPGAGFIVSKASVGDIIRIDILSDNNNVSDSTDKLDKLRSGDFLIYNARHTFKDTRHDVALTVCKLVRE